MATYRFNNGVKTDNLYSIGAILTANNDISVASGNNLTVVDGNVSLNGAAGVLSIANTTASTGVGTGALQISGGVYVAAASVIDNTLDLGNILNLTNGTDALRKITNGPSLGSGVSFNDSDYVTKWYVDSVATGVNPVGETNYATTATDGNIGPVPAPGAATDVINGTGQLPNIDGVLPNQNDIILLKNQTNLESNGIYTVTDNGSNTGGNTANFVLTRISDLNNGDNAQGALTFVSGGATQAGDQYICTATFPSDVVNTNDLPWNLFSSAVTPSLNQVLAAGNSTSGTNINITSGDSITGTGVLPITAGDTSNLELNGGSGNGAAGGVVDINGGNGTSGTDGGAITINAGTGDGAGAGADVSITAGSSATGNAGNVVLDAPAPVGGIAGDISFTARGTTLTLNDATEVSLDTPPYAGITSIVGALNLIGSGGVAETLAQTLAAGDTTGANNIVVTTGQKVSGAAELLLDSTAGTLTATANGGNLVLSSDAQVSLTGDGNVSIVSTAGAITSTSGPGQVNNLTAGNGSGSAGGAVNLMAGNGLTATDNGGAMTINAGSATAGAAVGGNLTITAGGADSGVAGDVSISAGTSSTGNNGALTLTAPATANDANAKDITFTARNSSLTFNQLSDPSLVGFTTATSIVGALNELASNSGAGAKRIAYSLVNNQLDIGFNPSFDEIVYFPWDNTRNTDYTNATLVLHYTSGDGDLLIEIDDQINPVQSTSIPNGSGSDIFTFSFTPPAANSYITMAVRRNASGSSDWIIRGVSFEFNS